MSTADARLLAVTLATLCCWVCRALCEPPHVHLIIPEAAQRYLRSLGHRPRLTRLAVILSIATCVSLLALPADVHPELRDLRLAAASCGQRDAPYDPPTCYALAPGGVWVVEEMRADGTRRVVGTVAHPPSPGCSTFGRGMVEPPSFRCP